MARTVSDPSRIEWTGATWNPVPGCTQGSPGCQHGYAERLAKRLKAMGSPRYRTLFRLMSREDALDLPLRWRSGRQIFVNSMSDRFHEDGPVEFTTRCSDVVRKGPPPEARGHPTPGDPAAPGRPTRGTGCATQIIVGLG